MSQHPQSRKLTLSDLSHAFRTGSHKFSQTKLLSITYSALFTFIGFALYTILEAGKIAPMSHSLAGGFMLVGPALLAGFFSISDALDEGRNPGISDIFKGFRQSPAGLWGIALLCLFLFFIWLTEAATVYAFVVGTVPVSFIELLPPDSGVTGFLFFTSLGGALLAFITFVVTAFSVPLMYYSNSSMVTATVTSTRTVFRNFFVMMVWALLLVILIMGAAWFLPLLPLTLPLAAYTSLAIYRATFSE
ncbi:MAG: DUF2189 domain-containing protein [Gammaproteobacteria bacterium]|nr:DUF2189 domain-containing protein [Gammaproteobacteria bacterium]